MRNCLWALWLFWAVGPSVAIADEPLQLQLHLLGRSSVAGYQVQLDEKDWQWLRGKQVLRLGVSGADYPPFEITRNRDELEGITADYAALVAELLHVRIEVLRYRTRDAVMAALKRNEVDLLGTSNNFEAADPELSRSSAYAEDQPMLVTRQDEQMPVDLAGKRIAMVDDYLPATTVEAFIPTPACSATPQRWKRSGPWRSGRMTCTSGT